MKEIELKFIIATLENLRDGGLEVSAEITEETGYAISILQHELKTLTESPQTETKEKSFQYN